MVFKKPILIALCLSLQWGAVPAFATANEELSRLFQDRKWDATVQTASHILTRSPNDRDALVQGAYALFQKGYANAALVWLKRLTPAQWDEIRRQDEGFAEVVSLLQKKVPLTILPGAVSQNRQANGSSALRDEVLFSKGRAAHEAKRWADASRELNQISSQSRYFSVAHYLLGAAAIEQGFYDLASTEFSRLFEPSLFQESSEFWKDLKSNMSQEMGASLRVLVDFDGLSRIRRLGELGLMGIARVHYAKKQYEAALNQYQRIAPQSYYYPRARLERVWTLLQMNQHDRAQQEAAALAVEQKSFEAVEANTLRAIILADAGNTVAARHQLDTYTLLSKQIVTDLEKYTKYRISDALPNFVKTDLSEDQRLQALNNYRDILLKEVAQLREAGDQYYPVYQKLATQLAALTGEVDQAREKVTREVIEKRLADLRALSVQAHLIRAETFLEDREKLRGTFNGGEATQAMQQQHDKDLVNLLSSAVQEVEAAIPQMDKRNAYLEFRQSELLWELGTAHLILAQTEDKEKNDATGERLRGQSLQRVQKVVSDFPNFARKDQALFFMGFAQLESNKNKEAVGTLTQFARAYPLHANTPDAYRILGDEAFDANRFAEAIELYRKILESPDSSVLGYAFYKIAWSAYNLRDYAKSMLALEQAVLWTTRSKDGGKIVSLKKEARRDLINLYSEVGDERKAREYFMRFIGTDTSDWLVDLAKAYYESGQFEKAVHTYNVLISLKDDPKEAIGLYTALIDSHAHLLQWAEVINVSRDMIEKYGAQLQTPVTDETLPAFLAEKTVREASLSQHFEFKETDSPETVNRILTLDRLYFQGFGQWASAQDPLYKYAYFLYQKKMYPESAKAYVEHWARFKDTLKEPLREESLRNLLSALEKVEATHKMDEKDSDTPLPLSAEAKGIVDHAVEYREKYAAEKAARNINYLRASMFLKYQDWENGIKETQAIVDANAEDATGKAAFKNLRVAYYQTKQWDRTYAWANEMLSRPQAGMRSHVKDLTTIREEALFLWAEKTKDDKEAAALFLKAASDPRMQRLKEKSLYNAIVRLNKADDRMEVLRLSQQLEQANPKSENLTELTGIRGALYQEAGDYENALPLFEKFLKKPGEGVTADVVGQARLNTAMIAQGVGNIGQATALYQEYLKNAKKDASGVAQAKSALEYIQAMNNRQPASIEFKAWPEMMRKHAAFEKAPLPPGEGLAARIKGGAKNLESVVKLFMDVSSAEQTPDFYAFEAYCAVPPLYMRYASAVMDLAKGLPEADRGPVEGQLRTIAAPMNDRGMEIAIECVKKSLSAHHHGPLFRAINKQYGWEKDEKTSALVNSIIGQLGSGQPWLDPAKNMGTEPQIIEAHLNKKSSPDSWYSLAKTRLDKQKWTLSRLTFIDALNKEYKDAAGTGTLPKSPQFRGAILNALAYIEWKTSNPPGIEKLFEKALNEGSGLAGLNLAFIQLQQMRIDEGVASLKAALDKGALEAFPDLKANVVALVSPPVEVQPQ